MLGNTFDRALAELGAMFASLGVWMGWFQPAATFVLTLLCIVWYSLNIRGVMKTWRDRFTGGPTDFGPEA